MQRTYEFEILKSEGEFVAIPFDLDGATEGKTVEECYEMIADYLRATIEDAEMHGKRMPEPTFGNEPRHGGRVVPFSVVAGIETVERMSKSEAARVLGVTPGRVTQLIGANQLEVFSVDGREWVTRASVMARQSDAHGGGRPRKRVTGKAQARKATASQAVGKLNVIKGGLGTESGYRPTRRPPFGPSSISMSLGDAREG